LDDLKGVFPRMLARIVGKDETNLFVKSLLKKYRVLGPVKKDSEFWFDKIRSAEQLTFQYITTIFPPTKFFFLPAETLFSYKKDLIKQNYEKFDRKQLILGIHPCDVHGILVLDKYFLEPYTDPYYFRRRENTIVAALTCQEIGDRCFCESFGTGPDLKENYDLLLTDLGDRYLVEVGSYAGKQIVQAANLAQATHGDFIEKDERMKRAKSKFKRKVKTENLPEIMLGNLIHGIWIELDKKELSCGNCSLACPTCFCFSIHDVVDLTLKRGRRWREWDSCQLLEYAEVSMGGNFRKTRGARCRHWMNCKLCYVKLRHGMFGCVGCGRCIRDCPVGIDITEVARRVRGE
jgi:sulfhydrogenase subunit beta (sulfur reductase)